MDGRRARGWVALALGLLLLARPAVAAQSPEVIPADYASVLLLRVLAYDRTLSERCHGKLVVGIVYDPNGATSCQWKDQLVRALTQVGPRLPVRKMEATVISIPFTGPEAFADTLRKESVCVALLGPGLDSNVPDLARVTHQRATLSVGVVRSYLLQGVSLGFLVGSGRKAKVLVNVKASKEEGVEFEAGLLRLAEII